MLVRGPNPARPTMKKTRHTPNQIITKLHKVEAARAEGRTVADAVRDIGVSENTYYRWKRQYGSMDRNQLKQLKELEKENARLKKLVADLTLDKDRRSTPSECTGSGARMGSPIAQKRENAAELEAARTAAQGLGPAYRNHVWSYDFLFDTTGDGRRLKWMPILDEHTRECLALEVDRLITSTDVIAGWTGSLPSAEPLLSSGMTTARSLQSKPFEDISTT